jgi:hypothetical protein
MRRIVTEVADEFSSADAIRSIPSIDFRSSIDAVEGRVFVATSDLRHSTTDSVSLGPVGAARCSGKQ